MSDQTQRISNLITYSYNLLTTAQIHSTKSELRFCIGSNPARSMSKIRDGEDTTKKFKKQSKTGFLPDKELEIRTTVL